MRRLRRPDVTPPTLRPSGTGGQLAEQHLDDRAADPDAPLSFPGHWTRPDVRGALYAFHGRVCGYCARDLPGNDRGDVDHFRPKGQVEEAPSHGGYWWLAYTFGNYVLSCSTCNRTLKRYRFPLVRPRSSHYRFDQRGMLGREARALLDPVADALEDWVRPRWEDPLCPLEPRPGIPDVARLRVKKAVQFFRLNSDPDLVGARRKVVDAVQVALDGKRGGEAGLLAVRFRPHSLVAREMLSDVAPQNLPAPQMELDWLLRALLNELDVALKLYDEYETEFLELRIDELLWSLAVLWLDPPTGTPGGLDAFFATEGVDHLIRPLRDKLAAP